MLRDKLGRPTPSTVAYNRSDKHIRVDLPIVGEITMAPGETKEIPQDAFQFLSDPDNFFKPNGWPTGPDGRLLPPVTFPPAPSTMVPEPSLAGDAPPVPAGPVGLPPMTTAAQKVEASTDGRSIPNPGRRG